MPADGDIRFGPFRLDLRSQRLLRDDDAVAIQPRQFQLLQYFVEHAGELLTKNQLIDTVWKGTAVTDASLTQAMFHLRQILDPDDSTRYIETAARVGYRFVAPVSRVKTRRTDAELDALLAPHRALVDGRAAIESLEATATSRARRTFEALLADDPDEATCHVGLANACALEFEATRRDASPNVAALDMALSHAREACRLNAGYAEAWATLGFVLACAGQRADAVAALGRSVTIESDNWRHQLRLASASWGEERLRAARSTRELFPACPLAHWLAATVYVARGALAQAEREVDAGLAAAEDTGMDGRFAAVALHWLKGLLCLARGDEAEALAAFNRELAYESRGHLYGREIAANTWYAIGAVSWHRREHDQARAAFGEALTRVQGHPLAAAGLALVSSLSSSPSADAVSVPDVSIPIEVTIARAAILVARGDASGAASLVGAALAAAPPGNAGWTLPIEPLLVVSRAPDVWAPVLGRVRTRAG